MTLTNEGKHAKGTKSLVVSFVERPKVSQKFEKLAVFCCDNVRHVTGNDKDYLRKSPEWFGRDPRLTKGHYRVYCQPMLPVKLEV